LSDELVWKALADAKRRALLDLLAERPRTTGELCEHFAAASRGGLGRTGVLKHLTLLQRAELVIVRPEGRLRWNFLNPVPIQRACDRWVSRHVKDVARSLSRLKDFAEALEAQAKRPAPTARKPVRKGAPSRAR
jgi:DNA-binding transcriptional ArsR family regulator